MGIRDKGGFLSFLQRLLRAEGAACAIKIVGMHAQTKERAFI